MSALEPVLLTHDALRRPPSQLRYSAPARMPAVVACIEEFEPRTRSERVTRVFNVIVASLSAS
jgi:hypothetical protein